ncbi:Cyclic di-GMP phosphodiesterase Gmr [Afipia felis]|uniref:Cyclic di-GMP phosphodiesterase Gmr n=1 Tax=Afipia felis TaxID=1035 RepID=A0A090MHX1_AFIFE|nr:EAL domain-containing protein [Afipia felis]CEG07136.1 Cyclic di-GMP phosphodiesterase Gmr [Afipia felis]
MDVWRRIIRTGAIRFSGGLGLVVALSMMTAPVAHAVTDAEVAAGFSGVDQGSLTFQVVVDGLLVILILLAMFVWVMSALRRARRINARREFFVSSALNNLSQGIVITNARQVVTYCNDRYLQLYGLSRSDLRKNMTRFELMELRKARGMLAEDVETYWRDSMAPEGYMNVLPDGRRIRMKKETLANGGIVATHEDCTEEGRLSEELASTKRFLEMVLDNIPSAVMVKRIKDGKFVLANRAAETILNRKRDAIINQTVMEVHPEAAAKFVLQRDDAAIKQGGLVTEEHPIPTDNGLRLFATRRVTVTDEAGNPQYLIKTSDDITDRRETESRMAHMAYHDGLTGMPNRAAFLQALAQLIDACDGTNEEFAVLSMDLDRFKEVNDVFGHEIGDKLLIEVTKRLEKAAGAGVVARLGGDEYGMIIDGEQPTAAWKLAETVARMISQEFEIDGKTLRIGVTAGISIFPRNGRDGAALLANAGAALSRAKAKSRGSIVFYEAEMDQQIRDRRALHQELHNALRKGELTLHYQPLARARHTLSGDDVTGFETLVRWVHPTRGFVPPADFIPLSEESGLIVELGEWILREACREAASWPRHLQIAVNLSPVQFMHGDLVGLVHSILLETGLTPGRLELEITEGVLIDDFERSLLLLRRLKALGVRIAMDDFGSGYSSLTYLQAFPFDKIKIDRAFVMNLGRNQQSSAIIRSVIGLGHGLDISIVAEGVETQDQLSFLAVEACDQVQGYFLGKPAPIAQYDAWVGRKPHVEVEPGSNVVTIRRVS